MTKVNSEKSPKELTRKHSGNVEKGKSTNKILRYGIIAAIVVVVGLITYTILNNTVLKDSRPVAKVGNTTITVKQFTDRVSYERYLNIQTFQTYASSGFASILQAQLLGLQNQLDDYVNFGNTILNTMVGEAALVQKAQSMGITVTDAEVDAAIQSSFKYYPNGTPTAIIPSPTITSYPTSTLSALQSTLTYHTPIPMIPTRAPSATPVPSSTIETSVNATPGDRSSTSTPEPMATKIPATVTSTNAPTATEYTANSYQNLYATVIANYETNASFSESELRQHVSTILYERKIYDKLAAQVLPEQDMVWARHILVATQQQADEIETSLKKGGNWTDLAAQYSLDASNNAYSGDLGWFARGVMPKAVEDVAWSLSVGATSDPVKSDAGYHIIQVLGHEQRQLTADEMTTVQKSIYKAFIESAKAEYGVKKYDIWASVVPQFPSIQAQYRVATTPTPLP